jgi:hypothetical protein
MNQKEYESYRKMYNGLKTACANYLKLSASTKITVDFAVIMAARTILTEQDKSVPPAPVLPELLLEITNGLYTIIEESKKE